MSNGKVRLGFVGLRNVGKRHLREASGLEEVEIAAYADTDEARLQEACAEYGQAACYKDAHEVFADSSVDAVVLALPNHLHESMTTAAMEAGKDVLVEKPISRTSDEARRMIEARDKAGKMLMVGMNQRFQPFHRAVKAEIDAGSIGGIYYAKSRWHMQRAPGGIWGRGDWFLKKETGGGGPLLDLGVHKLDLALHFLGFPEVYSVDGVTFSVLGKDEGDRRGKEYDLEDGGVALIRFKNGSSLFLEASYFVNLPNEGLVGIEIAGSEGGACDGKNARVARIGPEGEEEISLPETVEGEDSCIEHFAAALKGRTALTPTAEQGLVDMQILEALYESAESGKTVYFE